MTNKARNVEGVAIDVTDGDPVLIFGPELGAHFEQVPDEVRPQWRRVDGAWQAPPEPSPPRAAQVLEARKAAMLAALAEKRWQVETGGIAIAGAAIMTDRASQAMISGAYTGALRRPSVLIDFKGADGWVQLDADTMIAIGDAVFDHVQACFSRESQLHQSISSAVNVADLDAIDIEQGWPE